MDSRKRVEKILNCKETDKPAMFDNIRGYKVIEYFTGEQPTVENGKRLAIKAIDSCLD
jgi:hypothetical protein